MTSARAFTTPPPAAAAPEHRAGASEDGALLACIHCGLEVPPGFDARVLLDGRSEPVCCHGCAAAVQFLQGAGLEAWYRFREAPTGRQAALLAPELAADRSAAKRPWADPAVAGRYVSRDADGDHAILAIDGMRCAACAWLLEAGVGDLDGIGALRVDPASARLEISWAPERCSLDAVVERVQRLGFECVPAHDDAELQLHERQQRRSLRALGIAGIVAMQVMMLAIADYAGLFGAAGAGMEAGYRGLLLWAQMVLATVSVLLCAGSFFSNAWRALRQRRITMDVPVALAVGLAWTSSVALLLTGAAADGRHLYFDSVTMFVFLLLLGRHLEQGMRHRFARSDRSLGDLLPALARRWQGHADEAGTRWQEVPGETLAAGDRVQVRPGEAIPADGEITSGRGHIDRSVLSGESEPIAVAIGDRVDAGARSTDGLFEMTVLRPARDSDVAGIPALLARARASRPRTERIADRIAAAFLAGVLAICALTGLLWLQIDPDRVLPVVLATLIVTCPCALSLATPTALTAAAIRLRRRGIIIGQPDALEAVATCTEVCLDKTGTVTDPEHRQLRQGSGPTSARAIVVALERDIDHPLAAALRSALPATRQVASSVRQIAGAGVEGEIDGAAYRFGREAFALDSLPDDSARIQDGRDMHAVHDGTCGTDDADHIDDADDANGPDVAVDAAGEEYGDAEPGNLVLSRRSGERWRELARFALTERLRPDALPMVQSLSALGLEALLLSGDRRARVAAVARRLGIRRWRSDADPAAKLDWLRARMTATLDRPAAQVLYVGDGINDAPALGGATAALAVGSASEFARRAADMVLLRPDLAAIPDLIRIARATRRRIRINLGWAIGYNLLALPLAMSGLITPWIAALGMSASSLLVTAGSAALLSGSAGDESKPAAEPPADLPLGEAH